MAFVCLSLIHFAQHSHLQLIVLSPTQLCSLWGNNTPFSFSVHLVMDTQADSTWGLLWTLATTNTIMDVQVFLPHSDFDSFKEHPGMAQLDCLFSVFRGLSFLVSMVSGVISVSPAMDRGSSPFTVTGFSGCFPYDSRSDCRQDLCTSDLHLPDGRGCRGFLSCIYWTSVFLLLRTVCRIYLLPYWLDYSSFGITFESFIYSG